MKTSPVQTQMAAQGYVSKAAASRALKVSKPTIARMCKAAKLVSLKHGNHTFVLWGKLRASMGPVADLLKVPVTAADALKS